VEGSFCADARAGKARAHLLSTWFNASGKNAASHTSLSRPSESSLLNDSLG
jgi:hypothetical protein